MAEPSGFGPNMSWDDLLKGMGVNPNNGEEGGAQQPQPEIHFKKPSKKALIPIVIVGILLVAFLYWWFHPAINIHSDSLWSFVCLFIFLPLFLLFRSLSKKAKEGSLKEPPNAKKAGTFKKLSWVPVGAFVLVLVGAVAGASFIPGNAARYSSILPITTEDFAEDIEMVDYDTIPVIDRDSAVLLGNRTLGEIPEYVSQFEISNMYSQINYQGRPVRVSPLNYEDFFKWVNNMSTGLPGYVIVDMASQNTKVVRTETPIYYSESEPFDRNIDRYVQLKYPFYMFEEKSFEIDEEGTPWWVCPVQTRTIGLFGGETIERVVLVNASTGECQDYAIEDCPQWVDRAYPSDLLVQQYNWYGTYLNGWLNSWLGQTGVTQTTPGTNGLPGYNYVVKDDDVWMYTGVTSATADNSIIGFVLVNQRTSEAHFYYISGATEASAMESAEGQVQNLRYSATFPLLLNINDQPTYFMALKDGAGLVKKYAMIDIQRYQNVAVGDTVSECQKSYKALLASNGVGATSSDGTEAAGLVVKGTIHSMASAVIDGNTHFYVTLEDNDQIFDCALPAQLEIVGYKEGDKIKLTYIAGDGICTVSAIG